MKYATALCMLTTGLAMASRASAASFPTGQGSLFQIEIPQSLHDETGGYDHIEGHYGVWKILRPNEGSMTLPIYFIDDSLCEISPWTPDNIWPTPPEGTPSDLGSPFLLMTKRGNCTMSTKTRHAQRLGAAGLVIANNNCICGGEACSPQDKPNCEEVPPPMRSDVPITDITIPSILLPQDQADAIIQELRSANSPALAIYAWHEAKQALVDYYIISDGPTDRYTFSILQEFQNVAAAFESSIVLHHHYKVYDGHALGCMHQGNATRCADMCTNHGRYCHPSDRGIAGKDLLTEIVRRACIRNTATSKHVHGDDLWLDYIVNFDEHCGASPETFSDPHCIQKAMRAIHNKDDIHVCVTDDTGGVDKDGVNAVLDAALMQIHHRIVTPAIVVEGRHLAQPTAEHLFTTLCSQFDADFVPHVCVACSHTSSPLQCAQSMAKRRQHPRRKRKHHGWLIFLFFFVSAVGGAAFYVYKKRQEENGGEGGHWTLQEALMGDTI